MMSTPDVPMEPQLTVLVYQKSAALAAVVPRDREGRIISRCVGTALAAVVLINQMEVCSGRCSVRRGGVIFEWIDRGRRIISGWFHTAVVVVVPIIKIGFRCG